ncbi:MAG: hypothetical protein ACXVRZ_17345 [Gaiellaceae bacterium]
METGEVWLSTGLVVVLGLLALVAAEVVAAPWSWHTRLTVRGASLEVVGITLLALDIVMEPARRLVMRAAAASRRRISNILAAFYSTRPVVKILTVETALGAESAMSATPRKVPKLLDEQIAELRRELNALRFHVDSVETQLSDELRDLGKQLRQTRAELGEEIARAIEASKHQYHEWRIGGFALALANFL